MKGFIHRVMYNLLLKYRRMFHAPIPVGKPKVSVDILIQRCIDLMRVDPVCPYCDTPMQFRESNLAGRNPVRNDIAYKCPNCFHTAHFGIPITSKQFAKELDLRQGVYLMTHDVPFGVFSREDRKKILERLEALGYLEL